jgi:hypothetical protein
MAQRYKLSSIQNQGHRGINYFLHKTLINKGLHIYFFKN